MIDTIGVQFKASPSVYSAIFAKGVSFMKYDNVLDTEVFAVHSANVQLGSYDYRINFFLRDNYMVKVEFSVPKYLFEHNIFLCSYSDVHVALRDIHEFICSNFGVGIPRLQDWEVYRIDLCYAWKFIDQRGVEEVLEVIKRMKPPRKKKRVWPESVMFGGSTCSYKFYLKYPEFFAHDFKRLKNAGFTEFAYQMLDVAKGVLRYEVTVKKKKLQHLFDKKVVLVDNLDESVLLGFLKDSFESIFANMPFEYMRKEEIVRRLCEVYGDKKGMRLFVFYNFLLTDEAKTDLHKAYAKSTVYRYIQQIREADIPFSPNDIVTIPDFALSIPSENVVNAAGALVPPPHRY